MCYHFLNHHKNAFPNQINSITKQQQRRRNRRQRVYLNRLQSVSLLKSFSQLNGTNDQQHQISISKWSEAIQVILQVKYKRKTVELFYSFSLS